MNERLRNLYEFTDKTDFVLLEFAENCAALEAQVLDLMESLPWKDRAIMEAWIDVREEKWQMGSVPLTINRKRKSF